jgi:hypothetical protein
MYIRGSNVEKPHIILSLSRTGARYEPYSFRRFKEDKRYVILAYLLNLSQDLIDLAIEIHDRHNYLDLLGITSRNGKNRTLTRY